MGTDRSGCHPALGLSPGLSHTQVTGRSAQGAGASQAPPPSASPAGLGERPLILLRAPRGVEGKALRFSKDTRWVRYWARCFAELCAFSSHNSAKHIESLAWHGCRNQVKVNGGCEGDLAATSVTGLIRLAGLCPLLPHRSTCVPPETASCVLHPSQ